MDSGVFISQVICPEALDRVKVLVCAEKGLGTLATFALSCLGQGSCASKGCLAICITY